MDVQKIQAIRQAEQNAKNILASAEELVNAKLKESGIQSLQIMETQKQESRDYQTKILAEFQEKGEKESQTILSGLTKKVAEINQTANKEEAKAIAFVQEQMKVIYGNK